MVTTLKGSKLSAAVGEPRIKVHDSRYPTRGPWVVPNGQLYSGGRLRLWLVTTLQLKSDCEMASTAFWRDARSSLLAGEWV